MSWKLSIFRAGDLVEVRGRDEILATLDEQGCVDGLPFMPEMLAFCGQQFHVRAVAHKTCETAKQTWQGRRLASAVHLDNLRCDGSAHGDCQAECSLFWKDAWLKPANCVEKPSPVASRVTQQQLFQLTVARNDASTSDPVYSCQATKLFDATTPLSPWNFQQYFRDWWTGNHSLFYALGILWVASLEHWLTRIPFGYRLYISHLEWAHRRVTGRTRVEIQPGIANGQRTPNQPQGLKAGDLVRVKSVAEISATINEDRHNRGLSFDYEMAAYCGRVLRVKKVVTEIVNEDTGRMMRMKYPCIMLEGTYCGGEHSTCRLLCPRAVPSYWREIWLERVPAPIEEHHQQSDATDNAVEQHAVT